MTTDQASQALFLAVFLVLGAAWVASLRRTLSKGGGVADWPRRLLWAALALNVVALAHRWFVADHAPWANQYESATFVAFGVVALFAWFDRKLKVPGLGLFVIPAAMVAIAAASMLPEEYKKAGPLMPALQSYWLKIHVSLMLLSYGAFATTFGLSLMFLIKDGSWTKRTTRIALPLAGAVMGLFFSYVHASARSPFWDAFMGSLGWSELAGGLPKAYALWSVLGALAGFVLALLSGLLPTRLIDLFPSTETLEELNYQSVAMGFPLLCLGIILGAFWGHVAWGRYWAWDPKETWAFISMLVFAFFLHQRVLRGWDGRRLAWIGLLGAGTIVFTYWGVNFLLSGLHAYAKGN